MREGPCVNKDHPFVYEEKGIRQIGLRTRLKDAAEKSMAEL